MGDDTLSKFPSLPAFLERCVSEGLLENGTAQQIEADRRTSGLGIIGSLTEDRAVSGILQHASTLEETKPVLFPVPPNPMMTFEALVECQANAFPLELARIVASDGSRRKTYNPIYLYGPIGSGKTHLLSAIANMAGADQSLLINSEDLSVEHERAIKLGCRAELRRWIGAHDLLLFDDIQFCEGDVRLQRTVFSLFDAALRRGSMVIFTSDVPPTRLKDVEERLLSRLSSGVILALQLPEFAERREIVRRLPGGEAFSEDVLDYLAERISTTVRGLKAVGRQMLAQSNATGESLTVEMARALVPEPQDLVSRRTPPSVAAIPHNNPELVAANPAMDEQAEIFLKAAQFKQMLSEAETEEEQALALQIALSERLRDIRSGKTSAPTEAETLEHALTLLRDGQLNEALTIIGEIIPVGKP